MKSRHRPAALHLGSASYCQVVWFPPPRPQPLSHCIPRMPPRHTSSEPPSIEQKIISLLKIFSSTFIKPQACNFSILMHLCRTPSNKAPASLQPVFIFFKLVFWPPPIYIVCLDCSSGEVCGVWPPASGERGEWWPAHNSQGQRPAPGIMAQGDTGPVIQSSASITRRHNMEQKRNYWLHSWPPFPLTHIMKLSWTWTWW